MTDRLTALRELLAKAGAGEAIAWGYSKAAPRVVFGHHWRIAANAYCGSLDSALALHEAMLPGWHYSIDGEYKVVCVFDCLMGNTPVGKSDTPARAWLIAILCALIAQEEGR